MENKRGSIILSPVEEAAPAAAPDERNDADAGLLFSRESILMALSMSP